MIQIQQQPLFYFGEIMHLEWLRQVLQVNKEALELVIKALEKPKELTKQELAKCKELLQLLPFKPQSNRVRILKPVHNYLRVYPNK